jgi:quinol monooxygenase YgiN
MLTIYAQTVCNGQHFPSCWTQIKLTTMDKPKNEGLGTPDRDAQNSLVIMTALIEATPGRADELRRRLKEVVAETQAEPGCLEFRVFERKDSPGSFVLWETFTSQAALDDHIRQPYTIEYFRSGAAQSTRVLRLGALAEGSART